MTNEWLAVGVSFLNGAAYVGGAILLVVIAALLWSWLIYPGRPMNYADLEYEDDYQKSKEQRAREAGL